MPRRPVDDDGQIVSIPFAPPPAPVLFADPTPVQATNPGVFDLEVYRGDTMEWIFQLFGSEWVNGEWVADDRPVDISLWRFKTEIRSGVDGTLFAGLQRMVPVDPNYSLSTLEGRQLAVREMREGWIRMRLTANQSRQCSNGVWDLEGTTPDGWVKTLIRGNVRVVADVTTGNISYEGSA